MASAWGNTDGKSADDLRTGGARLIYPDIPPAGPTSMNDDIKRRARFETKVMDYLKFTIYDPKKSNPYNYINNPKKSKGPGEEGWNMKQGNIKFDGGRKEGDSTKGIWATVYLYLPHQLNEQYSTNYNRSALGPFGNSLLGAAGWAEEQMNKEGADIGAEGKGVTEMLQAGASVRGPQAVFQALTGAFNGASAITGGSIADKDALSALQNKQVFNPYEETTFKGVRYRSHSFNFDMAPRNYSEVQSIQRIIDVLRTAMLPSKAGANDEWLTIPKFFKTDIVRFTPSSLKTGEANRLSRPATLSKIMQFPVKMVLTDMQLNLTPNGQNTSLRDYDKNGNPIAEDYGPSAYKMTLRFDETAFLTNDLIWSELSGDHNRGTGVFGQEAPRAEMNPTIQQFINNFGPDEK